MADTLQQFKTFDIPRMPTTDDELWWFLQAIWGYRIPRTSVCKGHVSPFRAFADAYFGRSPVTVWKASRGYGGKSYTLAMLGLSEACFLGANVTILGGSGAQSLNVHAHSQELWDSPHAPRYLLAQPPTKFDTVLNNYGTIRSLMASQTSVRGPHPQRLRLDEIDEMDLEILEAAQGQPMRKRGIETQTVMSSTHQYPDKTMTAILTRAKEGGWPVYEWCYKETSNPHDGWLTAEEIERKRVEIPAAMWRTEYDLQEPSFDGRAIDTDSVDRAFDPALGEFDGDKAVIGLPEATGRYVTGIDWAKEHDWTIVATFDTKQTPWLCVAWQKMGRERWPVMVGRALAQWREYGGHLVHDQTGLGNVIHDQITDHVHPRMMDMVRGIVMVGREREAMFNEYISAIEAGMVKYPRITFAHDEHRFATMDDLFAGGKSGHPPDSFVAGALAWRLRSKFNQHDLVLHLGGTRESNPWMI